MYTEAAAAAVEPETKAMPPSVIIAAIKAFFEAKGRYRVGYIAWGRSTEKVEK